MKSLELTRLDPFHPLWPEMLPKRLNEAAPEALHAIGPVRVLGARRTAVFCSAKTPGGSILRSHDVARGLRDEGVTVVSGFHSPIEKAILRILLRGKQPVIICPARAIELMRIPSDCRAAFDEGRVLFLSAFTKFPTRVTKNSASRRNELVAALADEAYIPHVEPDSSTAQICEMLKGWDVPFL